MRRLKIIAALVLIIAFVCFTVSCTDDTGTQTPPDQQTPPVTDSEENNGGDGGQIDTDPGSGPEDEVEEPQAPPASDGSLTYSPNAEGGYTVTRFVAGTTAAVIPDEFNGKPVTEIGAGVFRSSRLVSVQIGANVKRIGDRAFSKCLFSYFTIPESVTYIGYGAFGMCDSLKQIVIPQSVTFLDSLAFAYCSNLEVAVVRAEIEVLNEKVFVNSVVNAAGTVYTDTSLKEVYLPSTLTKIHSTALSGNRISDIYFTGSEEQWNELYFFEMQKSEDDEDEYEEVRLEKSDVLSDSVTVHFNAEYPSLK